MVIDELLSLLPPPAQLTEQGTTGQWGAVTSKLGGPLPTDYMQFIDHYGSGTINSCLTVLNPFSANPHVNLLDQMFVQLSALRELRTSYPESFTVDGRRLHITYAQHTGSIAVVAFSVPDADLRIAANDS
ncbi:hypothetical protein IB278_33265 [Variovorax sp. VRV01]|uniref:hypothetical protein n=1 Tax=Variovorax sp. VRV01 TaxID=2769259 RepID=UPI0017827E5F|nr:hypothetical protein [Variovorax sp. VRV01]MBD9668836.1 hypothetical protein [Variovorax sp. VRV01]